MKSSIELITPDIAKTYLDLTFGNNRSIRNRIVDCYARDMKNGKWKISPQAIVFDENGKLIDGHHRLHAIIKANVPVEMYVVRETPRECVDVIDSGVGRTLSDRFKMSGKDSIYTSKSSQAIVRSIKYVVLGAKKNAESLSTAECEQLIAKYYNLCRFANSYKGKECISNSSFTLGLICALATGYDAKKVYAFMKCVNNGTIDVYADFAKEVNWKAANNFRSKYDNEYRKSGVRHISDLLYQTEYYLYLFVNNKSRTTLADVVYKPTEEQLISLNDKMENISFSTDWYNHLN